MFGNYRRGFLLHKFGLGVLFVRGRIVPLGFLANVHQRAKLCYVWPSCECRGILMLLLSETGDGWVAEAVFR